MTENTTTDDKQSYAYDLYNSTEPPTDPIDLSTDATAEDVLWWTPYYGRVNGIVDYGAFVTLSRATTGHKPDDLRGLLHETTLADDGYGLNNFEVGDRIVVEAIDEGETDRRVALRCLGRPDDWRLPEGPTSDAIAAPIPHWKWEESDIEIDTGALPVIEAADGNGESRTVAAVADMYEDEIADATRFGGDTGDTADETADDPFAPDAILSQFPSALNPPQRRIVVSLFRNPDTDYATHAAAIERPLKRVLATATSIATGSLGGEGEKGAITELRDGERRLAESYDELTEKQQACVDYFVKYGDDDRTWVARAATIKEESGIGIHPTSVRYTWNTYESLIEELRESEGADSHDSATPSATGDQTFISYTDTPRPLLEAEGYDVPDEDMDGYDVDQAAVAAAVDEYSPPYDLSRSRGVKTAEDGAAEEPEPEAEETPHECPHCDRIFSTEHGLDIHVGQWCSKAPGAEPSEEPEAEPEEPEPEAEPGPESVPEPVVSLADRIEDALDASLGDAAEDAADESELRAELREYIESARSMAYFDNLLNEAGKGYKRGRSDTLSDIESILNAHEEDD